MRKAQQSPRTARKFRAVTALPSTDLADCITTQAAAELLGVITTSVNHLLSSGRLQGIKLGRDWLVYRPSIEEYLKSKSAKGRPPKNNPSAGTQKVVLSETVGKWLGRF